MPKVAMWGDPHIGKLNKLIGDEEGLRLSRKLLAYQLRETREIGASHVVVLGDLFDHPFPTQDQLSLALEALSRARDLKILVYLGNHDIHDANNNSLKLLARLPEAGALTHVRFILEPEEFKWAGIRVLVLPYGSRVKEFNADCIFFHDNVVGAKGNKGYVIPMGEGLLPSVFSKTLAIGGHLHTPHSVEQIHFPGTIAQNGFGEEPEKRFSWLDTESLTIKSRPIKCPWYMETVDWSDGNPPACDQPNTFYRLRVGSERPGPQWMAKHPSVVRSKGSDKTKRHQAAQKIVNLMEGKNSNGESENELMKRWLKTYSPLDPVSIMKALRIHIKHAGGGDE